MRGIFSPPEERGHNPRQGGNSIPFRGPQVPQEAVTSEKHLFKIVQRCRKAPDLGGTDLGKKERIFLFLIGCQRSRTRRDAV